MWDKSIWEISSEVLWYEIISIWEINRTLNTMENNILSYDDQIHYLRILIKSMNQAQISFKDVKSEKKVINRILNIFIPIAKKLWDNIEYKNWLLKVYTWIEWYLKDTEFTSHRSNIRDDISRILNAGTQPNFTTKSDKLDWFGFRL